MKEKHAVHSKRDYHQKARAELAEASTHRIVEAFLKRAESEWFDKIRLEDIAADSDVTVQTVVRKFSSKEGILEAAVRHMGEAVRSRREVKPGELDQTVDALSHDYEHSGRLILRLLDQEGRHPVLKPTLDVGRRGHRAWLAEAFAEKLGLLTPARRQATLDALVVAADVYVWKLLRLDLERSVAAYKQMVKQMISAAFSATQASF